MSEEAPRPEKLETLLDAYKMSLHRADICAFSFRPLTHGKYFRMSRAFRARILRLDAEKDHLLSEWERLVGPTPAGDMFYDNVREFEDD